MAYPKFVDGERQKYTKKLFINYKLIDKYQKKIQHIKWTFSRHPALVFVISVVPTFITNPQISDDEVPSN